MVMLYIPVRTTATNYHAISSRNNPQGVDPSLTDYHGAVPTASGTGWMMSTTKSAFAVP